MLILGLEASTASAKAMLYDSGADRLVDLARQPYPSEIADIKTMDPQAGAEKLFRLGHRLLNGRRKIDLIVLSSIWHHSGVLLDEKMNPIGRLRTWADTRAGEVVESFLQEKGLSESIYQRTGNPPHTTYGYYQWLQLLKDKGMRPEQVHAFMALPDYLYYRFTDKRMVSTMTASASGMMNIHDLEWDLSLMERAGISPGQMSVLVDPEHTEPLAVRAAEALGLPQGIPVLVTGADGACNQIAVGGLEPGIMTLSVGTSGALRISGTRPLLSAGPLKNWSYYGAERHWINGAATNGAGSCLEWFLQLYGLPFSDLKRLDKELEGRDGLLPDAPLFLPFQFGERSPGWDASRLGGWMDLSPVHDQLHLYYSVLEGVLFNLYQCSLLLQELGGGPDKILISGGIVQSPVWLQLAADLFGVPLGLTSLEHASLLGAIMIGCKVLGDLSSLRQVKHTPASYIHPRRNEALAERYQRYLFWYEATATKEPTR